MTSLGLLTTFVASLAPVVAFVVAATAAGEPGPEGLLGAKAFIVFVFVGLPW